MRCAASARVAVGNRWWADNGGMLVPVPLRDLLIAPALHPRGQPHLSSASGLVRAGGFLHCVADDEHHMATLPLGGGPVALRRLRGGDLPSDFAERKRR